MANKLIGFLLTRDDSEIKSVVKNPNWVYIQRNFRDRTLLLWGIGNSHELKNEFLFSFPKTKSLEERNLIIRFKGDKIHLENDWLGSIPIFYNINTQSISTNINYCLPKGSSKDFDSIGLKSYLKYGYSVFEKTAFRDVRFLRYYSELILGDNNLEIIEKEDHFLKEIISQELTNELEVIESLSTQLNKQLEKTKNRTTILPISGGLDSRLLANLIQDKNKIRGFTYGVSPKQSDSYEVKFAEETCKNLNIDWEQIELTEFTKYIDEWFSQYGASVHIHGMYHIEFYKKIKQRLKGNNQAFLLSGIFGDIWADANNYSKIDNPEEVVKLGYTHNLNFGLNDLILDCEKEFISKNWKFVNNPRTQPVYVVRMKIILISYLLSLPEVYGIISFSPFLNFQTVKGILSLPKHKRKNRVWMKDYLKSKEGLCEIKKISYANTLDFDVWKNYEFEKIDTKPLLKLFPESKIKYKTPQVNFIENLINNSMRWTFGRYILKKLKLKSLFLKNVRQFQTLYPLIKSIQ